ncbi:MAG TPA: hypothetical protein VKB19_15710 [Pedobacter sp.]|nr:hypothetical protein [Pedobacter sp.]
MQIINPETPVTSEKDKQFKNRIDEIGSKYDRWFTGRINSFTGESDAIGNYFRNFLSAQGELQLYVKEGLPDEISKDIKLAFKSVYAN